MEARAASAKRCRPRSVRERGKLVLYVETGRTESQWNLAAEEYLFQTIRRQDCFMLWQNEKSVIVGKHQNTWAEVNQAYLEQAHIPAVRRLSGGGAVYHDLGNINFTFITDRQDPNKMHLGIFCQPVIKALAYLGIEAVVSGRNDLTIQGQKFSGNSQYQKGNRLLHHGTLLFSSDLDAAEQALRTPCGKVGSSGIPSVRSRVTNVQEHLGRKISLAEFKKLLLQSVFSDRQPERYVWTAAAYEAVAKLAHEKYSAWQWNYGESPACAVRKKRRVEGCGTVEAAFQVSNGRIQSMRFYGDFFGSREPEELAERFVGVPARADSYRQVIQPVNLEEYFFHMDSDSFLRLLLE